MRLKLPTLDAWLCVAVELLGGDPRDVGDVVVIGQRLLGKGLKSLTPGHPPPSFSEQYYTSCDAA